MKIIAIIYLALIIISKCAGVFMFGKESPPHSPGYWLAGLILNLPIYWILWQVATN